MSVLEFEGKNVEEAVEKACQELNLSKENLKHKVVYYGSTGIFGLVGNKKARIRVTVPEPKSTPETLNDEPQSDRSYEQTNKVYSPIQTTIAEGGSHTFSDDQKEVGRDALQRIIDFITTDAKISVEDGSDRIFFNVEGGKSAVLIGKRGQTLEAIQHIVEKIINKHSSERVRVQIDVEGYLENRRASLKGLARRLAEKAKRTGKPATVGTMNAHDRRIVHIALQDDSGVRTQSMGDGFLRKLVIFPRKHSSSRSRTDRTN